MRKIDADRLKWVVSCHLVLTHDKLMSIIDNEPTVEEKLQAKLDEYTELESEENMGFNIETIFDLEEEKESNEEEDMGEAKNYIAEFMKDNGLEVGEEFSIHDSSGFDNCFFCKDYSLSIASEDSFLDGETVLIELLTGQINPIKIKRQ